MFMLVFEIHGNNQEQENDESNNNLLLARVCLLLTILWHFGEYFGKSILLLVLILIPVKFFVTTINKHYILYICIYKKPLENVFW